MSASATNSARDEGKSRLVVVDGYSEGERRPCGASANRFRVQPNVIFNPFFEDFEDAANSVDVEPGSLDDSTIGISLGPNGAEYYAEKVIRAALDVFYRGTWTNRKSPLEVARDEMEANMP